MHTSISDASICIIFIFNKYLPNKFLFVTFPIEKMLWLV